MKRTHCTTQVWTVLLLMSTLTNGTIQASHYRQLYVDLCEHFFDNDQHPPLRSSAVAWDMLIDENKSLNPHAGLTTDKVLAQAQKQGEDPISLGVLPQDPVKLLVIPYRAHHMQPHSNTQPTDLYVYRIFDIEMFLQLIQAAKSSNRTAQEPFTRDTIPKNIQQKIHAYCGHSGTAHNPTLPIWHLLAFIGSPSSWIY